MGCIMRGTLIAVLAWWVPSVWAGESLRLDFSPDPVARFKARPTQTLSCPTCREAPVVDGKLDEPAWQRAAVIDRLAIPEPRTTVRICADKDALYLGVVCHERPGRTAKGEARPRDIGAYNDDCIEIWIQPDLSRAISYQFVVSVANSIYDSLRVGGKGRASHNPEWRHAVMRGKTAWTVEIAIPFAAVGLPRWQREIGFNIGRNGPGLSHRAWGASYGDASKSMLILPDAAEAHKAEDRRQLAESDATLTVGKGLRLHFERLYARPGERWIQGDIALRLGKNPWSATRVKATLFGLKDPARPRVLDQIAVTPERARGIVAVDLRRHGLSHAEVAVEFFDGEERAGLVKAFLSTQPPAHPLIPGTKIPILLDPPAGVGALTAWPVSFGVPFAPGALWDTSSLRLVDKRGAELPAQKEVTGHWASEGSIKWVRFDALVNTGRGCFVEAAAPGKASVPSRPLRLERRGDEILVNTGVADYVLGPGKSPIKQVRVGDRTVATSDGARGLYVVDQAGRVAAASSEGESVRVEARGPVAACVRFEGSYRYADGKQAARHITRVELFAGWPLAKVTHTFILTNDTNKLWFRDVGLEMAVAPGADPQALFGVSREDWRKHAAYGLAGGPVAMLQDKHYHFAHSTNHFSVDRLKPGGGAEKLLEGEECGDWAAVAGRDSGWLVSCREAARQHPKEFEIRPDKVTLHLFSPRGGDELDFRVPALAKRWDLVNWYDKVRSRSKKRVDIVKKIRAFSTSAMGWAKTHELLLGPIASADPAYAARVSRAHSAQVFAHVHPEWLCASGAMGPIHPRDTARFPHVEKAIDAAFRYWQGRIHS